jgi:predicted RNA-binding protein (virulence factor B family)
MRTMIRYGVILVAAGAFTPAWGTGMTKHEPTPPTSSEAKQDEPAAADGSRVSGSMYKDDQDEVRANAKKHSAKKAKKATPPASSEAKQTKQDEPAAADGSRVSGNMYKDDQDEVRANARKEAARKARRTPPATSEDK